MKFSNANYRLYAVTGREYHPGVRLEDAVRAALTGGATVIQLREKHRPTAEVAELGKALLPICHRFGAPLIIDDDVEAARLCNADGVHVGQSDMALSAARRVLGDDKIIGVSAQTVEQARQAEAGGADYLGVGAVFPTGTKLDADKVELAELKAIAEAVKIPVVAIGGITKLNVPELVGCRLAGISVVSAIFGAPDIAEAARELRQLVEAWR